MQYLGGKSRIASQIINYIEAERSESQVWVEPFMGSCSVLSQARGKRIGSDKHKELVSMFKALQNGWIPPDSITEEEYNKIKNNRSAFPDHLVAFAGFACSFGGMYFDAFARSQEGGGVNFADRGKRMLLKKINLMRDVNFYHCDYYELDVPDKSVIYCDPPYKNTVGYGFEFNHDDFYQWCRDKVKEGHKVYISEYESPFRKVWKCNLRCAVDKKAGMREECLFSVHEPSLFTLRKY